MNIPIVDISSLNLYGDNVNDILKDLSIKFKNALSESGFIVIQHHDIPQELVSRLQNLNKQFFRLPQAKKNEVSYRAPVPRGYSGRGKENFACLVGEKKPNDLVEKFRIGPLDETCEDKSRILTKEEKVLYFPNKWPKEPIGFEKSLREYYTLMEHLSMRLLELFEVCLELPRGFFKSKVSRHCSILSCNCYPPIRISSKLHPEQQRLAKHTDVSLFTIVLASDYSEACSNTSNGLEILSPSNEWISLPSIPNSLILNIGDALSFWTQNFWKSTPHRVALPSKAEMDTSRYSVSYFFNADFDAQLTRIPSCDQLQGKDYVETTFSQWRSNRIRVALSKLKS